MKAVVIIQVTVKWKLSVEEIVQMMNKNNNKQIKIKNQNFHLINHKFLINKQFTEMRRAEEQI